MLLRRAARWCGLETALGLVGPDVRRARTRLSRRSIIALSVPCGMMIAVNSKELIDVWQRLLADPHKSWVLFEHGTCVVLTAPEGEPADQATALLKQFGPARAGSSAGDFGVIDLEDIEGWVVTGHHNDVLTYVGPDEPQDQSEIAVGLYGRAKRHRDGTELHVVHVEDKRGSADPA
ncbi:hypothetical protein [Streptomyces phaeoluteigriseus]